MTPTDDDPTPGQWFLARYYIALAVLGIALIAAALGKGGGP